MSRGSRAVASPHVVSIGDFRPLARLRLPRPVFDYLDGGADGEVTLRENCRVFDDVTFRPRYAVPLSPCDLRTRVLGFEVSFPALLAPVGYSRLMHPDGEKGAARAAGAAGTAYILSTISGHRVEDVKAASSGPVCFQLYLMGGREASEAVIERARVAGCAALVVTIDTPVAGMRERDFRNGMKELMGGSLLSKIPFLPQMLARPGWLVSYLLDGGLSRLPNVVIPGKGPMELIDVAAALARAAVTWDDLSWIRKHWPGPIVIKGLLTGDDARRAVDAGAAAVVVSNHGGRQLDGVVPVVAGVARSGGGSGWPGRSVDGWRHSSRLRYRQGDLPGRESRSLRTCVCLRPGRRRRSGRDPGARNPAGRCGPYPQTTGVHIHCSTGPVIRRCAGQLAVIPSCTFVSLVVHAFKSFNHQGPKVHEGNHFLSSL